VPPRIFRRWDTRLGRFVHSYGMERLVDSFGLLGAPTTPSTIYAWLSGRSTPSFTRLVALERISGGDITPQVVIQHRVQAQGTPPVSRPCAASTRTGGS